MKNKIEFFFCTIHFEENYLDVKVSERGEMVGNVGLGGGMGNEKRKRAVGRIFFLLMERHLLAIFFFSSME